MRSRDRRARGAALAAACAGACAALAVSACAAAPSSGVDDAHAAASSAAASSTAAATSRGSASAAASGSAATAAADAAAGPTLRQRAEAAASALLRSFAAPPGGHRLAGPPNLPGGVLQTPLSYLGSTAMVHLTGFWQAPGSPQALLAWEQAHLPGRFTAGDSDVGPPAWDRAFQFPAVGALITRELDVEVASAGDGQTGIRLDAWVAWQPPRPAGSLIPATARAVTIAEQSDGSQVGPGGPAPARPPAPVTITDQAAVRGIAALIDGLPVSTIPPDVPCPAGIGDFLSLTFLAGPGGPALATVRTRQPCDGVALVVGGRQQPTLQDDEPTLNDKILTLAGLSWKLGEG